MEDRLTGGDPPAHDGDDLVIGDRFEIQRQAAEPVARLSPPR
jgi:hypothetical protein